MLPAILARVVIAALKRWAPKAVGAGLTALGIIEAGELARDAWRTFFGDNADEAQEGGLHPELAPPELLEYLRVQMESKGGPSRRGDVIEEEELLEELERVDRRDPAADLSVQLLPPPREETNCETNKAPRARRKRK